MEEYDNDVETNENENAVETEEAESIDNDDSQIGSNIDWWGVCEWLN